MLNKSEYQCVILDLNLPDIPGLDLLDKIKAVDGFSELPRNCKYGHGAG